jgi:uncharacterized membrane protein YGL010W
MLMKQSLREYLEEYAAEHTQLGTRVTHMIGIPMIVASLPLLPLNPPVAAALFAGGWAFQLVGHYLFEHNQPALVRDPFFLLVGVIWAAIEWAELFGVRIPVVGEAEGEVVFHGGDGDAARA